MTRFELAKFACKVLALWAFTQAALFGSGVLLMLIIAIGGGRSGQGSRWQDLSEAAATGVPAVGALIVGMLLWFGASRLAPKMISQGPALVIPAGLSLESLYSLVFVAVGLFNIIQPLRDLAGTIIEIVRGKYKFAQWWASANWQADFWSSILGLALSIWLIFGSRAIVRFVLWIRTAGVAKDSNPEAS